MRCGAPAAGSHCAAAASRGTASTSSLRHIQVGNRSNACRGRCRRREKADIAVDARRVGPIRFDRDDVEAVRRDQLLRDRGAGPVEFGGAVRRLAEQHHLGVAEPVEKGAERRVVFRLRQIFTAAAQQPRQILRFSLLPPLQQH